jgi:HSP20 family protein
MTIHQNTLTIEGQRKPEAKEPEISFHRRELTYGSFSRSIALPFSVDAIQIDASACDGILTIAVRI